MKKHNQKYISVKDHSVSGEEFQLIQNKDYGFLETTPQPSLDNLSKYYESEDYISHTNTKRNLFEKVYHQVRKVSLNKKVTLINSFNCEEKNLLDIGCGTGAFLEAAKNNGWNIKGIEPDENARSIANELTNNVVAQSLGFSKLKLQSFDVISLWHVLEHLPELEKQISEFKKYLKPKGTLIIAVPNYKSYDAQYYKNFWAAYDVPRHLWHFSKISISNLFQKENMQVVKIKPMIFDAYYVSLLSEKYKTKSMNPFKAFYIGLKSNLKAKRSGEYSSLIYIIKNT